MKNNLGSENGQTKILETPLITNISETMNETYKKQMEISTEMYNQLLGIPFSKEKTTQNEDYYDMNFFKNTLSLFEKNIETYTDLMKRISLFTIDSFYREKETIDYSEKVFESLVGMNEKQMMQIKEFNSIFFEALEKNNKGTSFDSSPIIATLKNKIEENLDSSMNTLKTILKPNNKNLWTEINSQMNSVIKSNLTFWSDIIISMNKVTKQEQKESNEKAKKETKKEPLPQIVKSK